MDEVRAERLRQARAVLDAAEKDESVQFLFALHKDGYCEFGDWTTTEARARMVASIAGEGCACKQPNCANAVFFASVVGNYTALTGEVRETIRTGRLN